MNKLTTYLRYLNGLIAVQIPHFGSFVTGCCKYFTAVLLIQSTEAESGKRMHHVSY